VYVCDFNSVVSCASLVSYFKNDIKLGGAYAIIVGCGQYYNWAKGLAGKFSGSEVGKYQLFASVNLVCDVYQQDVRITLFVNGYSGHTLLKSDACFEGVLHIKPNVK
jgi:hypothetical protein